MSHEQILAEWLKFKNPGEELIKSFPVMEKQHPHADFDFLFLFRPGNLYVEVKFRRVNLNFNNGHIDGYTTPSIKRAPGANVEVSIALSPDRRPA